MPTGKTPTGATSVDLRTARIMTRPPNRRETAVIDNLVTLARPLILTEFSADSCIASTRIGIDVLCYFGIKAQPLPVHAVAANPAANTLIAGNAANLEQHLGRPWTVSLGTGTGEWIPGHLIIAIPSLQVLIDLTLDQASRPQHGLALAPAWWHVPAPAFWADSQPHICLVRSDDVALTYHRRPAERGFLRSPNWRRTSDHDTAATAVFRRIIATVIRQIKAALTQLPS